MFSREVVAPASLSNLSGGTRLFLAGGITGCEPWQSDATWALLNSTMGGDGVILNPRRKDFSIHMISATEEQIRWEHRALELADMILFWFPREQIQPIALFELGRWSHSPKPIFVGADPAYPRRLDIEIQMRLERPRLKVHSRLSDVISDVLAYLDPPQ